MIDSKYVTQDRRVFFQIAEKYINANSHILDIGAGDAGFAKSINRSDVFMFDGNPETISHLQKTYKNVFLGKLPDLPFDDLQFDLVHCSHVVEHLQPQELYELLSNIDKILKSDGFLIISAPMLWTEFYSDMSHVKPYYPYVFIKYLSLGDQNMLTRPKVSDKYIIVENITRYFDRTNNTISFYHANRIVYKLMKVAKEIIFKFGFRTLEPSGFTLVLQKK